VAAVRRIVVGVQGSLGSLQALRYAAEEARERNVPLVPVIAWIPPGGDLAERRSPSLYLRQVWGDAARQRLLAAFDAGLGGVPADLRVEPRVERGETGPVLVDIADQPGDLLVIGTGRRSLIGRALHKSVGRYCLAHAKCPVLAVPPSALMDEMGRGFRPWPLRGRRALVPDISELAES
jgi:nucleotide-binding universal stress UspA family protein